MNSFKITTYTDSLSIQLTKKFQSKPSDKAKEVVHPIFGKCFQRTIANSPRGSFSIQGFSSLEEAVTAFRQAPSVILGEPTRGQGPRDRESARDHKNRLVLLDVEFFDENLRSIEDIALDILRRLGNPNADFIAVPSASYGCRFSDGIKNAIRLFVGNSEAIELSELKKVLPSTRAQVEAWGTSMIDTVIYQPERLIFTQVDTSEYPATDFYSQSVRRIEGINFELSQIPQFASKRSMNRTGVVAQADTSDLLLSLLELKFPSDELVGDRSAERHLKMVEAACAVIGWGLELGLDSKEAFYTWSERIGRSLQDVNGIWGWACSTAEKSPYFARSLELIASMIPNTSPGYIKLDTFPKVLALWCSMGSGKTVYSRKWIAENHQEGKKTLVVVPRVALAKAVASDLSQALDLKVKHYKESDAYLGDVIVTTIHSALKFLDLGIGSVVVDEVVQVRKDLSSKPMIRTVARLNESTGENKSMTAIWNQLLSAPNLLLCDAYMGQGAFLDEIQALRPEICVHRHLTAPKQLVRVADDFRTWWSWIWDRVVLDGQKTLLCFSSKKKAEELAIALREQGKAVLVISADNNKEEGLLDDVDTEWAKFDCVFTTTAISSGVSFDTADHFDFVGGYFADRISLSVTDELQMMGRVRKPKTRDVLIYTNNLAPKGLFEIGDLEKQVSAIYVEREELRSLSRERIAQGLARVSSATLDIKTLAQATLDLDPSFPLLEKIIREEVIGETGHKNFWKAFAYFFGQAQETFVDESETKLAEEARKRGKKAIKDARAAVLSALDSCVLERDVEITAGFSFEEAESMLQKRGQLDAVSQVKVRSIWISKHFPTLEQDKYIVEDRKMRQLANVVLLSKGSSQKATTTLQVLASEEISREAGLLVLREALSSYKDDLKVKKTWNRLRKLEGKYQGFFCKVIGIDLSLDCAEKEQRRLIHLLAAELGWAFETKLVRKGTERVYETSFLEKASASEHLA